MGGMGKSGKIKVPPTSKDADRNSRSIMTIGDLYSCT
jgi:hypothetical protein